VPVKIYITVVVMLCVVIVEKECGRRQNLSGGSLVIEIPEKQDAEIDIVL